jgi:hypothetical protein
MEAAKVAIRSLGRRTLRRMMHVSSMWAVLEAAHTVATGHVNRRGTSQQRQRCGEQRNNYNDSLGVAHCG